jgi:hypothetical protein
MAEKRCRPPELPGGRNRFRLAHVRDGGAAEERWPWVNFFHFGGNMSSEKSVVIVPQPARNLCPICGKASYSLGGVHPQCAMKQADEPRVDRLRIAKAAEAKTKKPRRQTWKKRCPNCGAQVHARREACECGHRFGGR